VSKKKILFVGCSFTADSGFTNENAVKYGWPSLLSKHFNCYYYNAGIGGSSNEEIFYRTIELTSSQSYDLVVIMWSSLGRKWFYFSEPNIDNYTIIHPGPSGWNSNSAEVKDISKLYLTYFNNQYVALKQWLDQIICLQRYFKYSNQPYVFIKGFGNLIYEFDSITYAGNGFENMSDVVKTILNFDNNPDYVLCEKITQVQQLIQQVDVTSWIDFKNFSFIKSAVDQADDGVHPGTKTNQHIALKLIEHINERRLLG
jgi:hypothetical protein